VYGELTSILREEREQYAAYLDSFAGQDSAGQDSAGQDSAGQDSAGQDSGEAGR
jgi:hypothetical protein